MMSHLIAQGQASVAAPPAGVRPDQARARLSPIPAARPHASERGVGADLQRPLPAEALYGDSEMSGIAEAPRGRERDRPRHVDVARRRTTVAAEPLGRQPYSDRLLGHDGLGSFPWQSMIQRVSSVPKMPGRKVLIAQGHTWVSMTEYRHDRSLRHTGHRGAPETSDT